MQSIGSYRADAAGWAADECCFQRKRLNLAFAVKGIWKGDVVICFVCVRGELITLPRSKYMERYFGCSFFTTFFLREKESGGKKSAHKRGVRRDSLRSYSAQFPLLCISP